MEKAMLKNGHNFLVLNLRFWMGFLFQSFFIKQYIITMENYIIKLLIIKVKFK